MLYLYNEINKDMKTTIEQYKKVYSEGKAAAGDFDKYRFFYTPIFNAVFEMGLNGEDIDFDKIVEGYRYGAVPESGRSYNYREEVLEKGCSLACVDGEKEVGSSVWFCDRPKVRVKGILLEERGSDGEALVLPLGIEQDDF